jgi:cytoskeletal protein CcmA (bactofilin family)
MKWIGTLIACVAGIIMVSLIKLKTIRMGPKFRYDGKVITEAIEIKRSKGTTLTGLYPM